MRSTRFAASLLALVALAPPILIPHAQAAGVGKIEAVARQLLERLGITSGGAYAAFSGGSLDAQITWDSSLGAITHVAGPADETLVISSGSGQSLDLSVAGTWRTRITSTSTSLSGGLYVFGDSSAIYARYIEMVDSQEVFLGNGLDFSMSYEPVNTVDCAVFGVDVTSRTLLVTDIDTRAYNYGLGAFVHPTLVLWQADNTDVDGYLYIQHDGSYGIFSAASGAARIEAPDGVGLWDDGVRIFSSDAVQGSNVWAGHLRLQDDQMLRLGTGDDRFAQGETTALTDGSSTTVLSVVTGTDPGAIGLEITYTIRCDDGTEYQSEQGTVLIAIVDDAGGVVAGINETAGTAQALSAGTLSSAWAVTTTDDGSLEVTLTATSSLTTTAMEVAWSANCTGNVTLTVP